MKKTATGYSAYAPDLPGCIASGKTEEETRQLMSEAIAFHIEGLIEEGMQIPPAISKAETIAINPA